MKSVRTRGFTLIELLTVIAILSILFAISAVAVPRVLERARIANAEGVMHDLRTALSAYFSDHGTFPPAYGYLQNPDEGDAPLRFNLMPYTAWLNIHRALDNYDPFSLSHDTNQNNQIDLLEFSPYGQQGTPGSFTFPDQLYDGTNLQDEVTQQLNSQRPIIYIPVNSDDARLVRDFYFSTGQRAEFDFREAMYAQIWPENDPRLSRVRERPALYDSFVLISMGPQEHTSGVVAEPLGLGFENEDNVYYFTALRTYFLATRDLTGDGSPDFDYRSRTRGNSGDPMAYGEYDADGSQQFNLLPDGSNRAGPMIMRY